MSTEPLLRRVPSDIDFSIDVRSHAGDLLDPEDVLATTVGVIFRHIAVSSAPILNVQWSVEGFPGSTVANYVPTTDVGVVTNLRAESLHERELRFGWWRPGTYTVTAAIETPYGWGSASHTFRVTAPLVRDFNGITGSVGVGRYRGKTFLRLADSPARFGVDGLHVAATVAGVQSIGGTLAGIQLARNERFVTELDRQNWRMVTNGTYVLDVGATGGVWYQGHAVPVGTDGNNVQWDANDGPGIELNSEHICAAFIGDGDPIEPETYRLHLMFIANTAGAVWVPISIVQWCWGGFSQFVDGEWTAATDAMVSLSDPLEPVYPTWTQNTSDPGWIRY